MHYEEFCTALQEELLNRLDSSFVIHREHILKNNGTVLDSLTLLNSDSRCSPVISLQMLFERLENGSSIPEICDYIESIMNTRLPVSVSRIDSLNCFQDLKKKITFRIISQEKNGDFLQNVPWVPFLDLAIIFSLSIQSEGDLQISTVLTRAVSDAWNVSPDDLLVLAKENTPRIYPSVFKNLETVFEDFFPGSFSLLPQPQDISVPTLYIFTNASAHYGAACILYPDALKDLAEQFGSDLLIFPSSIHEVLMIPDSSSFSKSDYDIFRSTILHVNQEAVLPEDFLSDRLYRYDRTGGALTIFPEIP